MTLFTYFLFGGAGLLLVTLIGATAIWSMPPVSGDLLIVVAPPWSGGGETVVTRAGGWIVGIDGAWLSVVATGTTAEALRASGAWAVFDANVPPSFLCLQGANT